MILDSYSSAVLKSDLDYLIWAKKNNIAIVQGTPNFDCEPIGQHEVYDKLIAQGYEVKKTYTLWNKKQNKQYYEYKKKVSEQEKKNYYLHEMYFRYIYIADWMQNIEYAEVWLEKFLNKEELKNYKDFLIENKPRLPDCVFNKGQCDCTCPWFEARCTLETRDVLNVLNKYLMRKDNKYENYL